MQSKSGAEGKSQSEHPYPSGEAHPDRGDKDQVLKNQLNTGRGIPLHDVREPKVPTSVRVPLILVAVRDARETEMIWPEVEGN